MSEIPSSSPYGGESRADWWFNALMDPRDVFPPEFHEIITQLRLTNDAYTPDFDVLKNRLDSIAPVRGIFNITSTPPGFAPEEIREQWVGIALPIRGYINPREGVSVIAREAMELLKDKSPGAYQWWQKYIDDATSTRMGPRFAAMDFARNMVNVTTLIFDKRCGTGLPLTARPLQSETHKIEGIFTGLGEDN
jgi:hypothetical protein